MPLPPLPYTPPPDTGLVLLYADEHLLIFDKPAGLLSVPGRGADKADCMASRVQLRYADALVVHRLDMETSGLFLMARGEAMQKTLSGMFEQRQMEKSYLALVAGTPADARGRIDLPLICDWPNRPLQKVDHVQGKPATTFYEYLKAYPALDASLMQLRPITGRSHQLRVHMCALGHPILGDRLYALQGIQEKTSRLMLHAHSLAFTHPITQEDCSFVAIPAF
jgi:tRNA pseudouridine32 synthase/23S rRNA pseudouridine746 synthase